MAKRVYICTGSDCKRRNRVRKDIKAQLLAAGIKKLETVRCQKICKGPVFGLKIDGDYEWFRRVDVDDAPALIDLARGGRGNSRLRGKRVKKRSGKLRD